MLQTTSSLSLLRKSLGRTQNKKARKCDDCERDEREVGRRTSSDAHAFKRLVASLFARHAYSHARTLTFLFPEAALVLFSRKGAKKRLLAQSTRYTRSGFTMTETKAPSLHKTNKIPGKIASLDLTLTELRKLTRGRQITLKSLQAINGKSLESRHKFTGSTSQSSYNFMSQRSSIHIYLLFHI